ncbi:uncharacterized protein [Primulina huaijiensis]|uniref:uncharacterized protein isoform X2 n=1 Tax=Primulina huaijiensis TaxID=1492673 RepID=UPI003CC71E73
MSARRKIGEERLYYSPPALRRQNQQQQQLKLNSTPSIPERRELSPGSYLDRFLEHTTPAVPARHFPKTSLRTWRERDNEFHPFFILGDLWEFFREWSVYGAGVPMVLNEGDSVVQYYVPSLSGIQLYIDPSTMEKRIPHDDGDANSSRETSSDGGSEYGTDKDVSNNQKLSNQHAATVQEHNELTGRNNPSMGSTVGGDISNPPGLLIFEYFEKELPFHREPLADKAMKGCMMVAASSCYQLLDLFHTSLRPPIGLQMEFLKTQSSIHSCKMLPIGFGRCKLITLITAFLCHTTRIGDSSG